MYNYYLRSLIKGKVRHYLPGNIGGRGYNENGDQRWHSAEGGLKGGTLVVTSFLNDYNVL